MTPITSSSSPATTNPSSLSFGKKLFIWASGSGVSTWLKSNQSSQQKRLRFGITYVIVAAFSGIAALLAYQRIIPIWGALAGPIFMTVVLTIDSLIAAQYDDSRVGRQVSIYLGKAESKWLYNFKQFFFFILRMCMVSLTSAIAALLVQVVVFEQEIITQIRLEQHKELRAHADSLDNVRKDVDLQLVEAQARVDSAQLAQDQLILGYDHKIDSLRNFAIELRAQLPSEIAGTGGVSKNKRGDGTTAKAMRETADTLESQVRQLVAERDRLKTESMQASKLADMKKKFEEAKMGHQSAIASLEEEIQRFTEEVEARPINGLQFMLSALERAKEQGDNKLIKLFFWLFFVVEIIPVLAKFVSRPDNYIEILVREELESLATTNEAARQSLARITAATT